MSQHTREEIVNSMPRTGFFGHPKGLFTLMITELGTFQLLWNESNISLLLILFC